MRAATLPRIATGLSAIGYLVCLFLPWRRAVESGQLQVFAATFRGWDDLQGTLCGVLAFGLLVLVSRLLGEPGLRKARLMIECAAGLVFFTAVKLFADRPRSNGVLHEQYAYGAWTALALAVTALVSAAVADKGGFAAFAESLPGWARVDRL